MMRSELGGDVHGTVFAMKMDVVDLETPFPDAPEVPYVTKACSKRPRDMLQRREDTPEEGEEDTGEKKSTRGS
jgi:hypothetical protein